MAPGTTGARGSRLLTIVAAIVVLVLLSFLLGGALSTRRFLGRGVRKATNVVLKELPAELASHRREELQRRLECVAWAAETGGVDEARIGEFVRLCRAATADRRVDAGELREIETRAIALCVAAGGGIP